MTHLKNSLTNSDTRRFLRRDCWAPPLTLLQAPPQAQAIFDHLVNAVKKLNIPVATGEFGADMRVALVNDGPATFIVDSQAQD